jgi:hypothetical protein
VFNNTMCNILCQNTIDTYNLLQYKRHNVLVPSEPLSGQFDSLGLRTWREGGREGRERVCACVRTLWDPNLFTIPCQPGMKTVDQCVRNM